MLPLGRIRVHLKDYQGPLGFERGRDWTQFTKEEQITMMSLWCIFRSPLIMGGEMRDNDEFTLSPADQPGDFGHAPFWLRRPPGVPHG